MSELPEITEEQKTWAVILFPKEHDFFLNQVSVWAIVRTHEKVVRFQIDGLDATPYFSPGGWWTDEQKDLARDTAKDIPLGENVEYYGLDKEEGERLWKWIENRPACTFVHHNSWVSYFKDGIIPPHLRELFVDA